MGWNPNLRAPMGKIRVAEIDDLHTFRVIDDCGLEEAVSRCNNFNNRDCPVYPPGDEGNLLNERYVAFDENLELVCGRF